MSCDCTLMDSDALKYCRSVGHPLSQYSILFSIFQNSFTNRERFEKLGNKKP